MSIERFDNVLVLAPHTDDGEFGCGGTMARLIENGVKVTYAAFSTAAKSVPEGFPKDVLKHEVRAATGILGIAEADLKVYDFEVRTFPTMRQDILEEMIVLQRELDPDCVLLPALIDLHQDHKTVAEEGLRAFKRTTVMAYEIPWNNLNFRSRPTCGWRSATSRRRSRRSPATPARAIATTSTRTTSATWGSPAASTSAASTPRCSRSTAGSLAPHAAATSPESA